MQKGNMPSVDLPVSPPFSLRQSLAFLGRFPPCRGEYVLDGESVTAAISIDGRAIPFTISDEREPRVEVSAELSSKSRRAITTAASRFLSTEDDLTEFYSAAADDDERFREVVEELHGLHHVRFLTLEEITVYAVLMQRSPVAQAASRKRRFLERFGRPVLVGDHVLRAMPEMSELVNLEAADYASAIGHAQKAALLPAVVRSVASLGERFLRTAPYDEAREALLDIPGIGPFSAAAILLRGLGRMDDLQGSGQFADAARVIYGEGFDEATTRRRYGRTIGYWAFYVMTAAGRRSSPRRHPIGTLRSARGRNTPERGTSPSHAAHSRLR
jgi:DNA-3-methyladenine glycosylase II